jgi:hypothetical protein
VGQGEGSQICGDEAFKEMSATHNAVESLEMLNILENSRFPYLCDASKALFENEASKTELQTSVVRTHNFDSKNCEFWFRGKNMKK